MKCTRITVLLLLLLSCSQLYVRDVEAIGITVTVAGIAAALGGGYFSKDIILCYLECCNDRKSNQWINFQPSFEEIEQKLFGQHIAVQLVKRSIRQHLKNENPPKALVLSFHGYTGVGKNYLASLIAKAIYRQYALEGESKFVNTLVATHFLSGDEMADKEKLKAMIETGISICERSIFIIDEVDKYPERFLDNLIPYIESNNKFNGYSYNKAIFLLLGNSGGEAINAQTNVLRAQGVSRDKIPLTSYDSILNSKAIREGGLKNAELISRGIIDLFVPFLPLERENVKKCIEVYLRDHRNYTTPLIKPGSEFIEKVADQLTYIPDTDVYSRFGCKRVAVTVDIMINDD